MYNSFKDYHPMVTFIYFTLVFGLTMFIMHPIGLIISSLSGVLYYFSLRLEKNRDFGYMALIIITTALINPAFNHQGVTILTYLPTGNPLTLESIIYGLVAGLMLSSMLIWFKLFNQIITSEKFIYLFGRIIPKLALVTSMALRFIPKYRDQLDKIIASQKTMGRDIHSGSIITRMKNAITIFSISVTWALESSIETADSMRARGYGLANRSSFSKYTYEDRDKKVIQILLALGVYILIAISIGQLKWIYFPFIKGAKISFYTITVWIAYLMLFSMPIIINYKGERQWAITQLKN